MRANIAEELLDAIDERIYLDLEIHVLTGKINKSDNQGFIDYIDKLITDLIKQRKELNDYLNKNGIKIHDVQVDDDGEFLEYPYTVKVMGGFKEGTMRYWRTAIKFKLNKRMSNYFGGD